MTLLILTVVVAPFVIVGATLAENADRMSDFVRGIIERGAARSAGLAGAASAGRRQRRPRTGRRSRTTAPACWTSCGASSIRCATSRSRAGAVVGDGLLQLTLSVLIAFFFYRDGEAIMARVRGAVSRISPSRGLHMLDVAGATTRAVVYGILGTALAQGVLMAIGLYIVGIKAAPLLGLVTFFLSPVPVGPPLVWIPAGLWLIFSQGETAWGIFLLPGARSSCRRSTTC